MAHPKATDALLDELDAVRRLNDAHIAKRRRLLLSDGDQPRSNGVFLSLDRVVDQTSNLPAIEASSVVGPLTRIINVTPQVEQALYSAFQEIFGAERDRDISFPADSQLLYRIIVRRRPDIIVDDDEYGLRTLERAVRQYARILGPAVIRVEDIVTNRPCLMVHKPNSPWARPLTRPKARPIGYRKPATKPPSSALEITPPIPLRVVQPTADDQKIEGIVETPSVAEVAGVEPLTELVTALSKPTAKERLARDVFKSKGKVYFREYCFWGTKAECLAATKSNRPCSRVHFRKIVKPFTDEGLGDCSYLNTCHRMDTCKFLHYEIDDNEISLIDLARLNATLMPITRLWPAQWLNCDIRKLDFSILGKFSVIMADPPWDIHMSLPYGTMTDDEMRKMAIAELQDDGFIFLWVTGRAMELGRECLEIWGYDRVGELVWIKTNQLQRLIRTGRTGHWLNHSKEHCLIGIKGNPKYNAWIDTDVLVAEVRETSRKPDEVYGLIDRLCPNSRKIEIFGRMHNTRDGWMTLGNQLDGVRIYEPDVLERYNKAHPDTPATLSTF